MSGPSDASTWQRRDAAPADVRAADAGAALDRYAADSRIADDSGRDAGRADRSEATDGTSSDRLPPDRRDPDAGPGDRSSGVDVPPSADSGCLSCPEDNSAACSDHIDNDGDRFVDCRDFGCALVWPCNIPETGQAACTDGHDNDGDRYVDCADYDCGDVWPCNVREDSAEACRDTYDNDGDGNTDCDDTSCRFLSVCALYENTAETCTDGVDNDESGLKDCADPQCQLLSVCATHEDDDATCSDRVDNDGDGAFDCRDSGCAAAAPCQVARLRLATWNIAGLGSAGGPAYQAARQVLQRVDPDLVCLQEIESADDAALQSLASELAYPYRFVSSISTPMSGGLRIACLSRVPIVEQQSRSSDDISTDSSANETGRDILQIRVEVRPGDRWLGLFSVHLKAGFDDADFFRSEVEALRLEQVIADYRSAHSNDAIAVTGDFNEEINGGNLGLVFSALPAGLPYSYRLGDDIALPITYNPFAGLTALGLQAADASLEDRPGQRATRFASNRRIDYLLLRGAAITGAELYDSCEDNGVDDAPLGDWLPKAGQALTCGTDQDASDHRLVFVDLEFP